MALAFGTLNEGKYVEAFGIYDGDIPVGFVPNGEISEGEDDSEVVLVLNEK